MGEIVNAATNGSTSPEETCLDELVSGSTEEQVDEIFQN